MGQQEIQALLDGADDRALAEERVRLAAWLGDPEALRRALVPWALGAGDPVRERLEGRLAL